jgi:DNA-binding NarL/FixJ family response regulator
MAGDAGEIRIMTVDDHALLRRGIRALIGAEPGLKLIAEASNGREAIAEFKKHRPDITLMDLQMPEMNGIECIIAIRSDFPDAQIIILTTYPGDVQVARALRAGARGYLLKGQVNRDLADVIRAVHAGQKRIPAEVAIGLAEHSAEDDLTLREIEVLRLIAAGNSNKETASRLCIAEETVKRHVTNILGKLHANDRTHAVTIALKRGIIEL